MAINHPTVKAAGQQLFAVADWNANHTIGPNTIVDADIAAHTSTKIAGFNTGAATTFAQGFDSAATSYVDTKFVINGAGNQTLAWNKAAVEEWIFYRDNATNDLIIRESGVANFMTFYDGAGISLHKPTSCDGVITATNALQVNAAAASANLQFQVAGANEWTLYREHSDNSFRIRETGVADFLHCKAGGNFEIQKQCNFAGSSYVASTVTHTGYVILKVAGTDRKFMIGE